MWVQGVVDEVKMSKVKVELSEWGLATSIGMVIERITELKEQEGKFQDPTGDRSAVLRDFAALLDDLRSGQRLAQKR